MANGPFNDERSTTVFLIGQVLQCARSEGVDGQPTCMEWSSFARAHAMHRHPCLTMRPDTDHHRVSRRNALRCMVLAIGGIVTRGLMAQDQVPRLGLLAPG